MASGATHLNQLFSEQTCPLAENLDLIFFLQTSELFFTYYHL